MLPLIPHIIHRIIWWSYSKITIIGCTKKHLKYKVYGWLLGDDSYTGFYEIIAVVQKVLKVSDMTVAYRSSSKDLHGPQVIWSAWRICRDDPTMPQLSLPILEIHWTPLHCRSRSRVPGEAGKCGQELAACAHTATSLPKVLLSVTGIFMLYTIMCSFWQYARILLLKRL